MIRGLLTDKPIQKKRLAKITRKEWLTKYFSFKVNVVNLTGTASGKRLLQSQDDETAVDYDEEKGTIDFKITTTTPTSKPKIIVTTNEQLIGQVNDPEEKLVLSKQEQRFNYDEPEPQ